MNRKHTVLLFMSLVLAFTLFITGSTPTQAAATDLLITGVVDGPLTGGIPKAVEFYVVNNIADLSIYGFGSANNGGGTDGEEFTFPADAATAGDFIYVATEAVAFNDFFGFAPTYTDGTAPNINGDDAIELFENGVVIDVFGDINVDGTGQPWDYLDGWVYRVSGTEADGSVFNLTNWTYSGINALDGETTNATAAIPFPIGTYTPPAAGDTTPPLISSFTPADDSVDVAVNSNLVIGFNEDVQFGSGNITLHLSSDDSVVEAFDVATSGQVSVSGSTVTIDPTSDLSNSTGYYVTIDNGAVEDLAGNPYQGFSGTGVWNFTTAGAAAEADLVISEIMYNPASAEDDWEWVEVYNAGGSTADLAGYVIDDINGTAHSSANIAAGTIAPGETAVLYNADDITAADFAAAWGNGANLIAVTNWGAMGLNNGGDTVSLWDSFAAYSGDHTTHANALVTVAFDDDGTVWPADDGAASIYLTNLAADANDGTNWALSTVGAVTPTFTAYQSLAGGGNSGSDIGSPAEAKVELVVSEIMYNPASAEDNWEWVEIVNVGVLTADLTDYVIDDNNSTAHAAANIAGGTVANGESAILYNADDITAADFEAAWGTGINLVAVSDWGAMALNNGGDTLGIWGSFADYSGDHATHANALISIAYDDSGSWPVDDGNGSIYLTDLAADPNDGANWALSGIGVDTPVFTGYQSIVAGGNSGSDVGSPAAESIPPAVCGDPITPIYDIQGNGFASLLDGDYVATEGIVTATFFGTNQMGGYYIQDAAGDGDAATSDGIYVFTTFFDTPVVGDKIRVSGQVDEYFGLTEITNVGNVLNCGADTPITATELSLPVASIDDFEAYEGMLVTFPQQLTVTNNFTLGRYGEIELSVNGRLYQPTNVVLPGTAANDLQDLNNRSRIQLDDGSNVQNPVPLPPYFNAEGTLRLGDTTDNLTAVMGYGFGVYELQPVGPVVFNNENPRTDAPDVGGSVQVASFNVLNYFTTIDDSGPICGPLADQGCRGADTADEFTRQHDKIVDAIVKMDADVVGLIEIENHATDDALQFLVDGLNAVAGAGTYDYIPTGPIGGDAIKVAFIYQPASVFPVGNYAILDSSFDPLFLDDYNRPALAQTFAEHGTGGTFTAVINHLKSKGSDCNDVNDPDTGDGQGNCNITRTNAAIVLANWLATDPTGSGDADFLIIGDLNSYAMEDPIMALTDAGYTNLMDAYNGLYSYQFQGQSGYLDHALANANLTAQVTGVAPWHINSDEPVALDYNNYNQPELYNADPYGSSDHDPVMVGLDLDRATNADGCYVLALEGSPFTGPATVLSIGDPGYTSGVFQARRWGSSEGLSRMACYEIHGTDERDVIVGGNSSDQLFGYGGDDVLVGLKGQDLFTGGTGADVMQGNQGIDEVLDYEFGIDICNSIEIGC